MKDIYINGVSIIAPGLMEPETVYKVLGNGDVQWQFEPLPKLVPDMLPANERRRTTPLIKIALQAIQPLLHVDDDLDETTTVFASSDGDSLIEDKICSALAHTDKMVSPTSFHNSVHNAPAGYWAIAASMKAGSVSLSAGDGSFSAGLIDAVSQVVSDERNVLLVAYDTVAPEKLDAVRHFEHSIAIALRLGFKPEENNIGKINLNVGTFNRNVTPCHNDSLEVLRKSNPIGAGIPLLEALISKSSSTIVLPYIMKQQLEVTVN